MPATSGVRQERDRPRANRQRQPASPSMEDVTERRHTQMQLRHNLRVTRSLFHQTVKSLGKTVRFRDSYTAGHQDNVARLAEAVARRLGLPEDTVIGIRVAGQLHDPGRRGRRGHS